MDKPIPITTLGKEHLPLIALLCLSTFGYFIFLGYNDIWRADEGLYAEAVREMLENWDFIHISFNYEPRYNKPPLMYWLMAFSALIFGLNEWALRLPVVLTGLGSVFLTYKIGALLDSKKLGIIAAIVMMYSFQFVINTRIANPTVPLTYFFTLTLYWLVKAIQLKSKNYLIGAYLALGLTLLMKGFPYFIIIMAIVGAYVLLQALDEKGLNWKKLLWPFPWYGMGLSLLIGMSWILYMFITAGDDFYQVYMDETVRRAFDEDKKVFQWKDLYYYLDAISWGFVPYSLTFFFGLIYLIATQFKLIRQNKVLQIALAWILVMYVIFTVARGKIPTYFIQAHPALSLFTAYFILHFKSENKIVKNLFQATYILPALVLLAAAILMIQSFEMPVFYLFFLFIPFLLLIINRAVKSEYFSLQFLPYYTLIFGFFIFLAGVLPQLEKNFRQYKELAAKIQPIILDETTPIYMEDRLFHNLPFYIEQKVIGPLTPKEILTHANHEAFIAIVPATSLGQYGGAKIIWSGHFYSRFGESRILEMMIDALKFKNGEKSRFKEYVLIYQS